MKKTIALLFVLGAMMTVSGCWGQSKTIQYVSFPKTAQRFESIDNPEMARIYIARPTKLEHNRAFTIMDGDTRLADIGPYGYVCWERKPGKTALSTSHVEGDHYKVDMDIEKGQIYYFQMYCWPISNSNIRPRTIDDGLGILRECLPPDIIKIKQN